MKITDSKVYTVSAENAGREPVTWTYLRIDTDEGITGWGEAGAARRDTALVCRTGLEEIQDLLIGENVVMKQGEIITTFPPEPYPEDGLESTPAPPFPKVEHGSVSS